MRLHELIDDYFDEVLKEDKKKISESEDVLTEEVESESDPEMERLKVLAGISRN